MSDEYYTQQFVIGKHTFSNPLGSIDHDLFWQWHQTTESYPRDHRDLGIEFTKGGTRQYVHAKVAYAMPRIVLDVGLAAPVQRPFGVSVGQVVSSRTDGVTIRHIASAQAWYYTDLRTLMLWEIDLGSDYRKANPREDELLRRLWVDFEIKLLNCFPDCKTILTPHGEPVYSTELFQGFLIDRGYKQGKKGTGVFHRIVRP